MKPRHPIDDPNHDIYHAGGVVGDRSMLGLWCYKMEKHLELHPETRYLFCEHMAYVGANGVLKDMFCRFCKEDMDAEADT